MDERKARSLTQAGLAASVAAAVGASICCIGPIAAAFLGLTSFGALVKYEPLRPILTLITLLFLGTAFYLAYRKRPPRPANQDPFAPLMDQRAYSESTGSRCGSLPPLCSPSSRFPPGRTGCSVKGEEK